MSRDKFVTPGEDLKVIPPEGEAEELSEEEKALLRKEAAAALIAESKDDHGMSMHDMEMDDEDENTED